MQPFDLGFQPGDRVIALIESIQELPRKLSGTLLSVNPVGILLAVAPGSVDPPIPHDDDVSPPLFLSWNTLRAVWLLGRAAPAPLTPEAWSTPQESVFQRHARILTAGNATPAKTQAFADWVPAGQVPSIVPVVVPPAVEQSIEEMTEIAEEESSFTAAFRAELAALRKAGKLYG